MFYVYPDPTVCVCLYVGNQAAYGTYRSNVFQKNLADEQQMTADINSMNDWDWGPWGGYPYPAGTKLGLSSHEEECDRGRLDQGGRDEHQHPFRW